MAAVRLLRLLLLLAYPFLVLWEPGRGSQWILGVLVLALFLPKLLRLGCQPGIFRLRNLLRTVLVAGVFLLIVSLWESSLLFLCLPVAINLSLLVFFGSTLREEQSLVERFARAQVDDLSPREVVYCRRVTLVWCVFFVLNAALSLALAQWASVEVWALYTGLIAHLLVGSLFAIEYLMRKALFRRFGQTWLDRLLFRLLPASDSSS